MRKIRGKTGRRLFGLLLSLVLLTGTLLIALSGNLSSTLSDPSGQTDISAAAPDESTEGPSVEITTGGSISGFLWVDGNGMPPTGWDGLYNGNEVPLPGFTVSLFCESDLAAVLRTVQTDQNGVYGFENLEPGSYVLGLAPAVVNGNEYLLPMAVKAQNKFAADWSSSPLMAYTSPIALATGQHVGNIDAGMRLPMGIVPTDLASDIAGTAVGGTVSPPGCGAWIVLKHQTVGSYKCTLLLRKGTFWHYPSEVFNSQGKGNNYEGSEIQTKITNEAYSYFSALYSIAVVPTLGTHTDYNAQSVPNAQMAQAAGIRKNVFFLLSRGDVFALNGNTASPLASYFRSNFTEPVMLRTAVSGSSTNVCEIQIGANQIGYGMIINASNATITPAVWVRTGVITHDVTVRYVDANGAISPPTTYTIEHGTNFTLNPAPTFQNYSYLHWKEGASGSPNTGTIQLTNVTQNREIFLVYQPHFTITYKSNDIADASWSHSAGFGSGTQQVTVKELMDTDFTAQPGIQFLGWNTQAAGKGTAYAPGASMPVSGNVTLYAQWGPATVKLTLTKIVDGDYGDRTKEFTFYVLFLHFDMHAEEHKLKHGQSVTIDVAAGRVISIQEIVPDGYTASYTDSLDPPGVVNEDVDYTGLLAMNADRTITFINTHSMPPLTGIGLGNIGAMLLLPAMAALLALGGYAARTVYRRRRQKDR